MIVCQDLNDSPRNRKEKDRWLQFLFPLGPWPLVIRHIATSAPFASVACPVGSEITSVRIPQTAVDAWLDGCRVSCPWLRRQRPQAKRSMAAIFGPWPRVFRHIALPHVNAQLIFVRFVGHWPRFPMRPPRAPPTSVLVPRGNIVVPFAPLVRPLTHFGWRVRRFWGICTGDSGNYPCSRSPDSWGRLAWCCFCPTGAALLVLAPWGGLGVLSAIALP